MTLLCHRWILSIHHCYVQLGVPGYSPPPIPLPALPPSLPSLTCQSWPTCSRGCPLAANSSVPATTNEACKHKRCAARSSSRQGNPFQLDLGHGPGRPSRHFGLKNSPAYAHMNPPHFAQPAHKTADGGTLHVMLQPVSACACEPHLMAWVGVECGDFSIHALFCACICLCLLTYSRVHSHTSFGRPTPTPSASFATLACLQLASSRHIPHLVTCTRMQTFLFSILLHS